MDIALLIKIRQQLHEYFWSGKSTSWCLNDDFLKINDILINYGQRLNV